MLPDPVCVVGAVLDCDGNEVASGETPGCANDGRSGATDGSEAADCSGVKVRAGGVAGASQASDCWLGATVASEGVGFASDWRRGATDPSDCWLGTTVAREAEGCEGCWRAGVKELCLGTAFGRQVPCSFQSPAPALVAGEPACCAGLEEMVGATGGVAGAREARDCWLGATEACAGEWRTAGSDWCLGPAVGIEKKSLKY